MQRSRSRTWQPPPGRASSTPYIGSFRRRCGRRGPWIEISGSRSRCFASWPWLPSPVMTLLFGRSLSKRSTSPPHQTRSVPRSGPAHSGALATPQRQTPAQQAHHADPAGPGRWAARGPGAGRGLRGRRPDLGRPAGLAHGERVRLDPKLERQSAEDVVADGLRHFAIYHSNPAVTRRGDRLFTTDRNLLFYYQNRLEGFAVWPEPELSAVLSPDRRALGGGQ